MNNPKEEFNEEQGRVLLRLARQSLCRRLGIPTDNDEDRALARSLQLDDMFRRRCGVFVTLQIKGRLRGCIGSLTGTETVQDGVMRNALCAAFSDSRFQPLTVNECERIDIEISILSEPQPLAYKDANDLLAKLRPQVDGVIIRKGVYGATFLPQVWDQLPHPEDFLSRLCQKAGLSSEIWRHEKLSVETYQVQHFHE
jgi:AmmeMemoRadiSam system protein A